MTANDLKLYHSVTSPNSRRVRIFLAEKGLTLPFGTGRSRQGRTTLRCLPRDQSVTRRANTRFEGRHRDRGGPDHLALSRRGLSDAASLGIDAERQGAGYDLPPGLSRLQCERMEKKMRKGTLRAA